IYQRYRDQMRWYIRALREISGQPVAQAHLYCLEAGVALQVEEGEPICYMPPPAPPPESFQW
ncbi:MAG: hypothetical protein GX650_04445, partial [Clostridiales bacterium]|nr:hypothetical protein [Clostridiales bacterium]